MQLLNGNKSARVRSSEGVDVRPCGCASDAVAWLQLCDAHHAEWHAMHAAAQLAHRATLAIPLSGHATADSKPGQE